MGLKEAGYPASAWEAWSRRDGGRYHPGECAKKWEGFRGSGNPITAGTIVSMARSGGWRPGGTGGHELGWNDMIGIDDREDGVVVEEGPSREVFRNPRQARTREFLRTTGDAGV